MADKQFRLRILTPERVFYEGMADMVIFQGVEGGTRGVAGISR
ncbi:MAG: hypothetical protein ACLR23_07620 [Clostridia bacterium]